MSLRKIVKSGMSIDMYDGEEYGFAGSVFIYKGTNQVEAFDKLLDGERELKVTFYDEKGALVGIFFTNKFIMDDVEVTL